MNTFLRIIFIIYIFGFFATAVEARKKDKDEGMDIPLIALAEPDLPVAPSVAHALVEVPEEAERYYLHRTKYRYGIDVSRYQGVIDWDAVGNDRNVSYVYLKATEGASLVDVRYHYNLRGARSAGLRVGCYHFFSPTIDAETQFRNFVSVVKLEEQDLIPIIDVETVGRSNIKRFRERLSKFLRMIEQHYGIRPIIYTSVNFYNKYLAGRYTEYKYMIARYGDVEPFLADDVEFVMWQFTANGRIDGIRGSVDRSRFMDGYHIGDILIRR